jgi:hypothetical protein
VRPRPGAGRGRGARRPEGAGGPAGLHVTGASLNAAKRLLRPASTPPRHEPRRLPTATPATPFPPTTAWPASRAAFAAEFPKTREGILYAVRRLRLDATLTLPDIRADAAAAGVKIGGRSLHSARALLNGRQRRAAPQAVASERGFVADHLRRLVADFEREAGREAERLRAAIEEAVKILRPALAE